MRVALKHGPENGRVIIVGAGAGGMMAAGRAAEMGEKVLLLEKTDGPGKKLLVSGKGRCNLTNTLELAAFIAMYGPNGRFLHSAFRRFFRDDLLAFLRRYGVETKVERGGRVFPVSDTAADVVAAFRRYLSEQGVELRAGARATGIAVRDGRVEGVRMEKGFLPARAVVLATGGATWPATGSSGDGYRMAAALGHVVTRLRPALVPLVVSEVGLAKAMQGVSLRNVRLTAFRGPAEAIYPALNPAKDVGR
ncbi:MAG: aminoacetone oxidase family FAD-binding enzyme, partial [Proteobacteria bacterium]|nr:aminoacetone oxidase family FAD-binding enzyme [Pseudomonadota bacterium]